MMWVVVSRKTKRQGSVDAQYNLAIKYLEGQDIKQNINLAIYWFTKASEQGDEDAKAYLEQLSQNKKGE